MNRQPYQATKYLNAWTAALTAAGKGPGDGPPSPYDTILTDTLSIGGQTPGTNQYPFLATDGPGYVWHCHILDHEDNEMMRPYIPIP